MSKKFITSGGHKWSEHLDSWKDEATELLWEKTPRHTCMCYELADDFIKSHPSNIKVRIPSIKEWEEVIKHGIKEVIDFALIYHCWSSTPYNESYQRVVNCKFEKTDGGNFKWNNWSTATWCVKK